ncbi:hypothetical protein ACX80D_05935 [Arthrobacter sp. Sr24]
MKSWLTRKIETDEATNKLHAALTPGQAPAFIDACASPAQFGMTAEDINQISHAMVNYRILAFGWGDIKDLGERGTPGYQGGVTQGSEPYERNQPGHRRPH